MSAKKGKPKPSRVTLYDVDVCAPDELDITEHPTDAELRRWWDRMRVYTKSMRALDRVTILCYIPDEVKFYLASVEEAPHV